MTNTNDIITTEIRLFSFERKLNCDLLYAKLYYAEMQRMIN
jgi:hypothetical protein